MVVVLQTTLVTFLEFSGIPGFVVVVVFVRLVLFGRTMRHFPAFFHTLAHSFSFSI